MRYADLAPMIQVDVIGAPVPLIASKMAECAHEFFRLTRAYQVTQRQASIPAGTKLVALTIPDGATLLELVRVKRGSMNLRHTEQDRIPANVDLIVGPPTYYAAEGKAVRLFPSPEGDLVEPLAVTFSVQPTLQARTLPDDIAERWQPALLAGTKSRLFRMSKKEWTDPAAAQWEEMEYQRLVNEARIAVRNEGATEMDLAVQGRFV